MEAAPRTARPGLFGLLAAPVLRLFWSIGHPMMISLKATPATCLAALAMAARPSRDRLHLRNHFSNGRRYMLRPVPDGFQMVSTSKLLGRRGRTTSAAIIIGKLTVNGEITQVRIYARMTPTHLLRMFAIPAGMALLEVFAPWPTSVIAMTLGVLFVLSWLGHRLTAVLEADEMTFFIQKVLEELAPADMPLLPAAGPDVVQEANSEFREQWQKFYETHKDE